MNMREITNATQMRNLIGQYISIIHKGRCKSMLLLGEGSPGYFYFVKGSEMEYAYFGDFGYRSGRYFAGEYDAKFLGDIMIKQHQHEIESIKEIYHS